MNLTIGKILSWLFGLSFLLGGLGSLEQSIPGGVALFITGIFLIPKVREAIADRFEVGFSRWLVVVITVVGLGIYGVFMPTSFGSEDTTPQGVDSPESSENTPQSSSSGDQDSEPVKTEYQVGETVRFENIHFTVSEQEFDSYSYGVNEFDSPQQGFEFVYIKVSAENTGERSLTAPSTIKLVVDGTQYDASFAPQLPPEMQEYEAYNDILPGTKEEGWVRYEVPDGTTPSEAAVMVDLGSFFSEEFVEWNLA